MTQKSGINVMLNLLKGCACIGVVFMHVQFPGLFGMLLSIASAYAVPIFYMIAGYYAFGKNEKVIKRRLIKITKIFLYSYVLFFIFRAVFEIKNGTFVHWINENFTWMTPIKYVLFCTIDFAIPLWYLIAMIEVYLLWMALIKLHKEDAALRFIPLLFILQIILTIYCETMKYNWFWKINFITMALPWFMTGYYFHTEKGERYKKTETYKLCITAVIGCAIVIIPTAFNLNLKFNCIGYIPYAFSLFLIALKYPDVSICKPLEYIGGKLSLNIYIFHMIILKLVRGCIKFVFRRFFNIDVENSIFLWCLPVIILISTIAFSFVIEIIKEHVYNLRNKNKIEIKQSQ